MITARKLLKRLLCETLKNKEVRDTIKISILRLLRTIIRIIRRNINISDSKRT